MKYILQKYKSKASRYTCPKCGRPHCFTRYINADTGEFVNSSVGRCDHEQSCGYNYTPAMFYRDHPWVKESESMNVKAKSSFDAAVPRPKPKAPYIPMDYVLRKIGYQNNFIMWLRSVIRNDSVVNNVIDMYNIGTGRPNKSGDCPVIFWQIDECNNVHDGKLMYYKPDGHRQQWMSWVSAKLKEANLFPEADTKKLFFGQHLLAARKDAIGLVESEKSAVVMACLFPGLVWIASCGCGGLNADKLRCLSSRKVIVFPDAGEADRWQRTLNDCSYLNIDYTLVRDVEVYQHNTDLVDILVDGAQPINGQPININNILQQFIN